VISSGSPLGDYRVRAAQKQAGDNAMTTATEPQPPRTKAPLEDRVALVTGGTRGIGAAISHHLAADGAEIAAGYWRHTEPAEKFLAEMTAAIPVAGSPCTTGTSAAAKTAVAWSATSSSSTVGWTSW
jgi:hypothetical protein